MPVPYRAGLSVYRQSGFWFNIPVLVTFIRGEKRANRWITLDRLLEEGRSFHCCIRIRIGADHHLLFVLMPGSVTPLWRDIGDTGELYPGVLFDVFDDEGIFLMAHEKWDVADATFSVYIDMCCVQE